MPIYAPCHLIQSSSGEAGKIVAKAKILVVEDDENILNLLSAYLESAGCEVVNVTGGMNKTGLALWSLFGVRA